MRKIPKHFQCVLKFLKLKILGCMLPLVRWPDSAFQWVFQAFKKAVPILYEAPYRKDEGQILVWTEMDADISVDELCTVLMKVKENMGPGTYGLPVEFLKCLCLLTYFWYFLIIHSLVRPTLNILNIISELWLSYFWYLKRVMKSRSVIIEAFLSWTCRLNCFWVWC